jgi:hypothetical protein
MNKFCMIERQIDRYGNFREGQEGRAGMMEPIDLAMPITRINA